jgi:hypothetical protein
VIADFANWDAVAAVDALEGVHGTGEVSTLYFVTSILAVCSSIAQAGQGDAFTGLTARLVQVAGWIVTVQLVLTVDAMTTKIADNVVRKGPPVGTEKPRTDGLLVGALEFIRTTVQAVVLTVTYVI